MFVARIGVLAYFQIAGYFDGWSGFVEDCFVFKNWFIVLKNCYNNCPVGGVDIGRLTIDCFCLGDSLGFDCSRLKSFFCLRNFYGYSGFENCRGLGRYYDFGYCRGL